MELVDSDTWAFPMAPNTERGFATHLTVSPDGKWLAYGSQNNVVVRSEEVFGQHPNRINAVQFAPKGGKIASIGADGDLKLWNYEHPKLSISYEVKAFEGKVKDIAWTADIERVAIAGEGANLEVVRTVHAKMKKTGKFLKNHTGPGNTVAFKGTRPYKLFSGSDDSTINLNKGPPFQFEKKLTFHSKFVNVLRTNPANTKVLSGSSDKKLVLFDAVTGEKITEYENAHNGSVYSIFWFPSGDKFVTCSADKLVKVWNLVDDQITLAHTLHLSPKPQVEDMQVGVAKLNNHIVSLSLSGVLNFWKIDGLEGENVEKPDFTLTGHRKNIVGVGYNAGALISVDIDGKILKFSNLTESPQVFELNAKVQQAVFSEDLKTVIAAKGKKVTIINAETLEVAQEFEVDGYVNSVRLLDADRVAVVTNKSALVIFKEGEEEFKIKIPEEPISVEFTQDRAHAFVGGNRGQFFRVNIAENKIDFKDNLNSKVTAIKISNQGNLVAVGTGTGAVAFFDNTKEEFISRSLKYHRNFITSLNFSADDKRVISTAYETLIYVWDTEKLMKKDKIQTEHRGAVNLLVLTEDGYITGGVDGSLRKAKYALGA